MTAPSTMIFHNLTGKKEIATTYTIKRDGNCIELVGGASLANQLRPFLSYTHIQYYRGLDLFKRKRLKKAGKLGENPNMSFKRIDLFAPTGDSLMMPAGLRHKLEFGLTYLGHSSTLQDLRRRRLGEPQYDRLAGIGITKFRHKQDEVLATIEAYDENMVIVAPTGWGKSTLAMMLCEIYHENHITFVAPGESLLRDLHAALVSKGFDVGIVGIGYDEPGHRVTLLSMDSMHKHNFAADDLLIIDEVHCLAANRRMDIFSRTWIDAKIVGFTASQGKRADGGDSLIEAWVGPVRLEIPYDEAVENNAVRPIKVVAVRIPPIPGYDNQMDPTSVGWQRKAVWRNADRNRILAWACNELVPTRSPVPDPQILVMVSKSDHAYHLKQFLPEYTLIYGNMTEGVKENLVKTGVAKEEEICPLSTKELDGLRTAFKEQTLRKAIATMKWKQGVDFPKLPVLVRADAESGGINNTQIPGRLSRIGELEYGLLIDTIDTFDTVAERKSRERMKSYRKMGWTIEVVNPPAHLLKEVVKNELFG